MLVSAVVYICLYLRALRGVDLVLMFVRLQESSGYPYFGTVLDTRENLDRATEGKLLDVSVSAAQTAGQMALRLVHDHILNLDVDEYTRVLRKNVVKIVKEIKRVCASVILFVKCVFMMRCKSCFSPWWWWCFFFPGCIT